jgi:hypothetical protein
MISLICEEMGGNLIDYISKIISLLNKRLAENDPQLNQAISEVYGSIFKAIISQMRPDDIDYTSIHILETLFRNMCHNNKILQIGIAMSLKKIIQCSSHEFLLKNQGFIITKILEILSNPICKAQNSLLEALLTLILGVERELNSLSKIMEFLLLMFEEGGEVECTAKKIAIDIFYAISVMMRERIEEYGDRLLRVLQESKSDKIKYVREAAMLTINLIKDMDGTPKTKSWSNSKKNSVSKTFHYDSIKDICKKNYF